MKIIQSAQLYLAILMQSQFYLNNAKDPKFHKFMYLMFIQIIVLFSAFLA